MALKKPVRQGQIKKKKAALRKITPKKPELQRQDKYPKQLRLFTQHGVTFPKDTDFTEEEVAANCPFCGKQAHFAIHIPTQRWQCKRNCAIGGEGGGAIDWMDLIYSHLCSGDVERLTPIAERRGIPVESLIAIGVRINLLTDEIEIPIRQIDTKRIYDLRHGPLGGNLMSTSTRKLGLLGWEKLSNVNSVWITEGEWDCAALLSCRLKDRETAIAVPGAGVFKKEWSSLFTDKVVYIAYDNDEAGYLGAKRVNQILSSIVKQIRFVLWDKEAPKGYDVNDLYIDSGEGTIDLLRSSAVEWRRYTEGVGIEDKDSKDKDSELFVVNDDEFSENCNLNVNDIYRTYSKWLRLEDYIVLDALFGSIIGNRRSGDPIWLYIVAPPGGTKTALLESLVDAPRILYKSTISARSLVSGQVLAGGLDPSLLKRLHEKILIIEDFTTLMSVNERDREEALGILRSAYNGSYEREWGNGRIFRCLCHFGVIAGVTPKIEQFFESSSAVGERFLTYRPPIPNDIHGRRKYVSRARQNEGKEEEMKADLRATAALALGCKYTEQPELSPEACRRLDDFALWASLLRGVVTRDRFTKDVIHLPYSEVATRLVKQFTKLSIGVCQFRGAKSLGPREFEVIRRTACDSINSNILAIIRIFMQKNDPSESISPKELSMATGLPEYPTIERILENLRLLGAVERINSASNIKILRQYRLKKDFLDLTIESHILKSFIDEEKEHLN